MALLLVVANVFGAGMIVPQLAKLARGGSVEGISARWVGASISLNLGWSTYAIAERLWGMVPVSLGASGLYIAMAAVLYRRIGPSVTRQLVEGLGAALIAPVVGFAVAGLPAMGLAMAASYGVQFLPAVWEAYRAPSVEGISATTWVMALVEAIVWFLYGLDRADAALVLGGIGGAACSAAILAALLIRRRRRPAVLELAAV